MPYMLMVEDMNWFECTNANPSEIMQMVQIAPILFDFKPKLHTHRNRWNPVIFENREISVV